MNQQLFQLEKELQCNFEDLRLLVTKKIKTILQPLLKKYKEIKFINYQGVIYFQTIVNNNKVFIFINSIQNENGDSFHDTNIVNTVQDLRHILVWIHQNFDEKHDIYLSDFQVTN